MPTKRGSGKILLKHVNKHITCGICKGYLIGATTASECLHTFCKSCIVKHLEENNTCPSCEGQPTNIIHQSHPMDFINADRTLQDIVYKLVSGLQEKEIAEETDFYKSRGKELPKHLLANGNTDAMKDLVIKDIGKDCNYHRLDEQIIVSLTPETTDQSPASESLKGLEAPYLCLSTNATITHLKKYISLKLYGSLQRFKEFDILCGGDLLGRDHTLKFVQLTRWRNMGDAALELTFKIHDDF